MSDLLVTNDNQQDSKILHSCRSKCWCFIAYPENCNIVDSMNEVVNFISYYAWSPLHDRDVTDDGEVKKAHFHVIVWFSSVKSLRQVQEISNYFSGVLPYPVTSEARLIRYFGHLDSPEKVQYDMDLCVSNHPEFKVLAASYDDILDYAIDYVRENGIIYFCDVVDAARKDVRLRSAVRSPSHRSIIMEYLKSYSFMLKNMYRT